VRVLVAMSGGVDSSVAAALLAEAGHDVVGCTLQLWGGPSDSGCCSAADVDDARRVAQVLGIDHHVFNLEDAFTGAVVDAYVDAHARGGTPNPCVECNRAIKFGALLERSFRLGFEALATGHHARVVAGRAGPELRRGVDRAKDQSYVLGFLDAARLASVVLPVGHHTKGEIRSMAASLGLRTACKPDSQDVCFIPRGSRADFLSARTPLTAARVVDATDGTELGEVPAAQLVTVGQRRGVARGREGTARYVVDVDLDAATVLVAPIEAAVVDSIPLAADSVCWARAALADGADVHVQTSAHGRAIRATSRLASDGRLELSEPIRPVAAGQLAVLYDGNDPDLVVGAGTVVRRAPVAA
jgi:tRNA-specific 2-thiouridylase